MKQRLCVVILGITLLLSGCGGGGSASQSQTKSYSDSNASGAASGEGFDSYNEPVGAQEDSPEQESPDESNISTEQGKLDKEMLVYTCNLRIDTLTFGESVEAFRKTIDDMGGFIASEQFEDDGESYGHTYYESRGADKSYTATVRIPSARYNEFVDSAGNLGDVRSKTSNVENISQEYGTAKSTLEIYQAKYERYLKLLKEAKDDATMLEIENQLTELEVKIAQLKTQLSVMETDVAYSYVNITINEVEKYTESERKDSFLVRLKEVCADSWSNFKNVLEGLLFLVIELWWYVAIIAVIVILVVRLSRRYQRKHPKKTYPYRPTQPEAVTYGQSPRPGVGMPTPTQEGQPETGVNGQNPRSGAGVPAQEEQPGSLCEMKP